MPLARLASRWFFVAIAAIAATAWTAPARAEGKWLEWHETSSDLRLIVAEDGTAQVERQVRVRVVAGPIRSLDVGTIDKGVVPAPTVELLTDAGDALGAHVEVGQQTVAVAVVGGAGNAVDPNANEEPMRVVVDQPEKGLKRGAYRAILRYGVDLVGTHRLTRDQSLFRLAWKASPSPEGHDASRAVFELPAAPTEPRVADPTSTTVSALERVPTMDRITLTRAHVGKSEAVSWEIRLDPRALPKATSPELRPPPPPAPKPENERSPFRVAVFAAAAAYAMLVALVARRRELARHVRNAHVVPLVAAPGFVRLYVAPVLAGAGVILVAFEHALAAGALAATAMALLVERSLRTRPRVRGPGAWRRLAAAPQEAERDLDQASLRGARIVLGTYVALATALYVVGRDAFGGLSLAVPLFALVPFPALLVDAFGARSFDAEARRVLVDVACALGVGAHVRMQLVARVPDGVDAPDEVRLEVAPLEPLPGLVAIEVACVAYRHLTGTAVFPEVLVRVTDGSHAHAKILAEQGASVLVPGRKPGERVLLVVPDGRKISAAASCVTRLAERLTDHRKEAVSGEARPKPKVERRVPPDQRLPLREKTTIVCAP
jgi:hypothetical protein